MCRFVLYLGPQVTLDLLTTRPAFSIIHQSYKSRMRVEPLNGDGFGLAWYVPSLSPEPAVFRSVQPAWNNMNLRHLARVTRSPAILAHVRAASMGMGVSEANCHPFVVGQLAFMHNGVVPEFPKLKRTLQARLSDEAFSLINGSTDSEHVFALFRDHLARLDGAESTEAMAQALQSTIAEVVELVRPLHATRNAFLNFAVSDGKRAVVSRYATGEADAPSLYLHAGKKYLCEDGVCHMVEADQEHQAVMIASEPLTEETSWHPVPKNHLVLVDTDRSVEIRRIA